LKSLTFCSVDFGKLLSFSSNMVYDSGSANDVSWVDVRVKLETVTELESLTLVVLKNRNSSKITYV